MDQQSESNYRGTGCGKAARTGLWGSGEATNRSTWKTLKYQRNGILAAAVFFTLTSMISGQINQSYFVYQKEGRIVVRGQIDGEIVYQNPDAAPAINKAIDLLEAQEGGELKISNGLYIIESPIFLKSNVRMEGSGFATVLRMGTKNKEGIVIKGTEVDEVKVSDLKLQGIDDIKASSGIIFDHVGMGIIEDVYSRDFGQYGIWLRNDCLMCEVVSCKTAGNDSAGVYLSWNRIGRGGSNLISNCKSYGEDGHAFELTHSTCNNLVGNMVDQCKGNGFYFHDHSCSNLISGCRVFRGYQNAVLCVRAHETNVTGNIFCWNKGHGIEFSDTKWGTISGNNIIDNGDVIDYSKDGWETGVSYGVYLHSDTRSVQVSGNAIFNWPDGHPPMIDGIYETADCKTNNIIGNNVQFYTGVPANINGENSIGENNIGDPHFYERFWTDEKIVNQTEPYQLLKPISRDVVDKMLEKTRR